MISGGHSNPFVTSLTVDILMKLKENFELNEYSAETGKLPTVKLIVFRIFETILSTLSQAFLWTVLFRSLKCFYQTIRGSKMYLDTLQNRIILFGIKEALWNDQAAVVKVPLQLYIGMIFLQSMHAAFNFIGEIF